MRSAAGAAPLFEAFSNLEHPLAYMPDNDGLELTAPGEIEALQLDPLVAGAGAHRRQPWPSLAEQTRGVTVPVTDAADNRLLEF